MESPTQSEPALRARNEESGLKGVLGLVLVAQGSPADAEHHRAVPLD